MPVNVFDRNIYEINYDDLYDHWNSLPIFPSDKKAQERYLHDWMECLHQADAYSSALYLNEDPKLINYIHSNNNGGELYSNILHYGNQTLYLQFRIFYVKTLFEKYKTECISLPLSEFTRPDTSLLWTPPDDEGCHYTSPIIAVQFYIGKNYKFMVIDGNHRIQNAIDRKLSNIDVILLPTESVASFNFLCTNFDLLLYIFNNEVVTMNMAVRSNPSLKHIYKDSFLYTHKIFNMEKSIPK